MGVTGRQWCDFVVWTLKGFLVERIIVNASLWKEMTEKLKAFCMEEVVAELFSERVKRGKNLF